MTLDYITIPIAVLTLSDLNIRQKLLLALVICFNDKGLRLSNKELAGFLDVWPSRVSKLLKDMESKNYIRVDNHQSRYRIIYLLQSAKVDELLLATKRKSKNVLLATKVEATCYQSRNISKDNICTFQKKRRLV
jgi:DNA-binding MarR family transcriptional regulator